FSAFYDDHLYLTPFPTRRSSDLVFQPEGLAGSAVPAFVGTLVDVALCVDLLEDRLNGPVMPLVGGADNGVVFHVQLGPELLKRGHNHIRILFGRAPLGLRSPLNLLPVLIGAGDKIHVPSREAMPAG